LQEGPQRALVGDMVPEELAEEALVGAGCGGLQRRGFIGQPLRQNDLGAGGEPTAARGARGTEPATEPTGLAAEGEVVCRFERGVAVHTLSEHRGKAGGRQEPPEGAQPNGRDLWAMAQGEAVERPLQLQEGPGGGLVVQDALGAFGEGRRRAEAGQIRGERRMRPGHVKAIERVQVAPWTQVDLRLPLSEKIDGATEPLF
jgi:hypothetical protein